LEGSIYDRERTGTREGEVMRGEAQVRDISKKLDLIVKLTALSATKGRTNTESIHILDIAGFTVNQIAEILGTNPAIVRNTKKLYGG
jgi:hypothetical protein